MDCLASDSGRRRHHRALDAVPRQRLRDHPAALGLLDKIPQRSVGRRATAGLHALGLLDHHEPARQQAQTAQPRGVGLRLLRHACGTPAATSAPCARKLQTTVGEVGVRNKVAALSLRDS